MNDITSAAQRMSAALAAIGATGEVKELPHAQLAYDPAAGVLAIALDYYELPLVESEIGVPCPPDPTWVAICAYVEAAGRDAGILEMPGDRELFRTADGGSIFDFPADSVLGEWLPSGVITWRVTAHRAPWGLPVAA